jgi:hypothetical protein
VQVNGVRFIGAGEPFNGIGKIERGLWIKKGEMSEASSVLLRDLAVDVLNAAKSGKDAKSKVFQLEQFREIILHRDTSLIEEFIGDVFDFTTEKSSVFRKFLLRFSTELFDLNANLTLPYLIDMYSFYLSESNDSVVAAMTREISRIYSKLVLAVYNFPNQQESRRLWPALRNIVGKLTEYVSSARSESIKVFGLQLMEAMMLFGIPTVTATSDPRLARKINDPRLRRAGGAAQSESSAVGGSSAPNASSNNADTIAAHHPFIAKNIIQSEAEDLFAKLCLWSGKSGPQSFAFTPRLMSLLGQMLAAVGIFRPHLGLQAAKAIVSIFVWKNNNSSLQDMTILEKEQLARAAIRLQRAITVYGATDGEDILTKLKSEVNNLSLNESATSETIESNISGKKRDYSDYIDEEDDEFVSEEHQSSVKSALQNLESNKRQMVERSQAQLDNKLFNVGKTEQQQRSAGYVLDARSLPPVLTADITELSAELVSLQNLSLASATKLVSVDVLPTSGETYLVPSMNFDGREYADLAQFNLLRVMDNFLFVKDMKSKASWKVCQELLLRSVLSLTLSSVQAGSMPFLVNLVQSLGNTMEGSGSTGNNMSSSIQELPTAVLLPRAIWLFVSFAFQVSQPIFPRAHATTEPGQSQSGAEEESRMMSLYLLSQFCQRFHACIIALEEEIANQTQSPDISPSLLRDYNIIYDNMILVILSRYLQIPSFRGYVKDWVATLPRVPLAAMHMVIVISQSGNKTLVPSQQHFHGSHGNQIHSQRYDALSLLGSFVFLQDDTVSKATLQYLLWQTLADDFKVRHKIIDLIINEIYHHDVEVDEIITRFALQSLVFLLDSTFVRSMYVPRIEELDTDRGAEEMDGANVDEMNEEEYAAYLLAKEQEQDKKSTRHIPARSLYEVLDSFDYQDDDAQRMEGHDEEDEAPVIDIHGFARHFQCISTSTDERDIQLPDPLKQQDNFTKAFHLLERLAVVDARMVVVFEEVCLLVLHHPTLSQSSTLEASNAGGGGASSANAEGDNEAPAEEDAAAADTAGSVCANKESWNIGVLVRTKLKVILADLLSRSTSSMNANNQHSTHLPKKWTPAELFALLAQIRRRFLLTSDDASDTNDQVAAGSAQERTEWLRDERALLVFALQCLMPQLDQPPKLDLIVQVLRYLHLSVSRLKEEKAATPVGGSNITDESAKDDMQLVDNSEESTGMDVDEEKENNAVAVADPPSEITLAEVETGLSDWLQIVDDDAFVFLSHLLAAFSSSTIFAALPRIVRVYTAPNFLLNRAVVNSTATGGSAAAAATSAAEMYTQLKNLFQRWIKPIPPPVVRATLLLHLLRIDNEAENIDRKAYLAVIDLCLANKGDFHAKVIKDCMEMVVNPPELTGSADADEKDVDKYSKWWIPPFAIMRMAILSAKNYPELIGSYVLHTMIPTFIRRQVWITAPKVWEGVVMAAKILAVSGTVHAEATIRALLGMPGPQLLGVLKVASYLLPVMKKVLAGMSSEHRETLLRAFTQYPPLPAALASSSSSAAASNIAKAEKDKEKLFKDILDGKIGGGSTATVKK